MMNKTCESCAKIHMCNIRDEDEIMFCTEWISDMDKEHAMEEEEVEPHRWGLAMMDALGEACKKEMESWSSEELEQAKENLKKSIDRAVEIGNQKHHIKGGPDYHAKQEFGKAKSLKDVIEWICKYVDEYKVDIDIHIDADGDVSVGVCPTYRDKDSRCYARGKERVDESSQQKL